MVITILLNYLKNDQRLTLHPDAEFRAAHPMPHAVDLSKAAMAQGLGRAVGALQAS